jgi:hypothetical protein
VDDIVIFSLPKNLEKMNLFTEDLMKSYEMRDLGQLNWFLGIRILRDRAHRKLWLCQDSYIEKIAKRYHLQDIRAPKTPLPYIKLLPNQQKATTQQINEYQSKIGSLIYATIITRPDCAFAASELAKYMQNPSQEHIQAINHAISYAYGSKALAIEYSAADQSMICASNASFADNLDRKSSEGYIFKLFYGLIDWKARKQSTVTTSTTEAEFLGLSSTIKEAYWWKRLFKAIGLDLEDQGIQVACDNAQTIQLVMSKNQKLNTKLKHVDIHSHWLRQEAQARKVAIYWVPTDKMIADGMTKQLPRQKHEEFIKMLGLVNISKQIQLVNTEGGMSA